MFLPFSLKFTRVLSGAVLLSALALTGCSSSDNNNASAPIPGVDPVGFYTAMTEINGEMYPVNPNQPRSSGGSIFEEDSYAIAYEGTLVIGTGDLQSLDEEQESLLYVFNYATEGNQMTGEGRLYLNGAIQPEVYTLRANVMLESNIIGSAVSQDASVPDKDISQFTLTYSAENTNTDMPQRIVKDEIAFGQNVNRWRFIDPAHLNFRNLIYSVNNNFEVIDSDRTSVRPNIIARPDIDIDDTCSIYGRADFDAMRDLPISQFEPVSNQNFFTSTLVLDTCKRVNGEDVPVIMQGLASVINISPRDSQPNNDDFKVFFFWNNEIGSYSVLENEIRN